MQQNATQPEDWQRRFEELEARLNLVVAQVHQREIDAAYLYIHSNWNLIRWFLTREQDQHGAGSETYQRARTAEQTIRDQLPRNLRAVQFDPQPMQVAYRWRIETTVTLNRNRYTFFD